MNEALTVLEKEMLQLPQAELPVVHTFMPGLYIREMHAKAGTLILGHEHKTRHTCMLLQGELEMLNSDGGSTLLRAPMIFAGEPGRKCAVARTDIIFCNLHVTDETDLTRIEEQVIEKSDAWLEAKTKEAITGA